MTRQTKYLFVNIIFEGLISGESRIQKHEYKHKLVCGQRLIEFGWSVGGQYSLNTNATSRQAIPMHIVCLFWCRNLQS